MQGLLIKTHIKWDIKMASDHALLSLPSPYNLD